MIEIEITKRFNDDIMFPMDIYTISVSLHPKPIKNKVMFKTIEDLDRYLNDCETVDYAYPIEEMTPREKLKAAYSEEVGNKVRWAVNDAIEFFSNLECVMDKKEIKKVINKLEKAKESLTYPFSVMTEEETKAKIKELGF